MKNTFEQTIEKLTELSNDDNIPSDLQSTISEIIDILRNSYDSDEEE